MSWPPQPSDVSEDLTAAAMWGDLRLLESLLENGADPNLPNTQGNSALHVASYYGETECASVLLSYKAKVNAPGADAKEPGERYESVSKIHENQMDIVRLLVSHSADLNATDHSGATPRDLALECDFYDCADLIDELKEIQEESERKRLKESRIQGLFMACEGGDLESVKTLLPCVPDAVNEFYYKGESPLMCAAACGHLSIVEFLLDHGAVAVASPKTNRTALHAACEAGHTDIVVCLLNRLPALLALDDLPEETSLHMAAREGHVEVVRNLLAIAARSEQLKTPEQSYKEEEPCLFGRENAKVRMNDSLGEIAIDIMAPSFRDERTPLHEAATHGHVEVVKLLVDFMREYCTKKPSSDSLLTPRKSDWTPMNLSESPCPGFSPQHQLNSRKANAVTGIDAMTLRGRTAFHEAARLGHFEVMEILLQAGADINAYMKPMLDETVNTDLTALVQACLMNRIDIVRFLLQHGATDARLKALTRSLRVPNDDAAGLLLCYNGGVHVMSADEVRASRHPSKKPKPADGPTPVMLHISWNSKKISYIRKEWLELARIETLRSKDMNAISHLDISSNNLKELPIVVFQLPYLKHLDVCRNKLQSLPTLPGRPNEGWTCQELQNLEMNSNQLSLLPACLFSLCELKEVYVNDNRLTEVPVCMWTAPKLQKLYMNRNMLESLPSPDWDMDSSPSVLNSPFAGNLNMVTESTPSMPDSGYSASEPDFRHYRTGSEYSFQHGVEEMIPRRKSLAQLPFQTVTSITSRKASTLAGKSRLQASTQSFVSRRFENFHDTSIEVDELEDLESIESSEGEGCDTPPLEMLDVSHNNLTAIPSGLSCLAPKLQKLNVSHNRIKSLGQLNDYPCDIEFFDVSDNELHTAMAASLSGIDSRFYYQPCARKLMGICPVEPMVNSFMFKPSCPHRTHRNLRKLTTLKLNNNNLVDLQLFRLVSRHRSGELTASFEESTAVTVKQRANTSSDPFAVVVSPQRQQSDISSKSIAITSSSSEVTRSASFKRGKVKMSELKDLSPCPDSSNSSPSNSSQEGSGSSAPLNSPLMIISPLFPQLSTLEVSRNRLKNVPPHLHLLTNLSCLVLSHNADIDTLPLELSNLDHLWNLEYEGCPLTNPPAVDLDKFRLAADKLMYMRSLLHDAKPNESLKLMLVGLQRMGKTTLLSRLKEVNETITPATTFTQRVGDAPLAASLMLKGGKKSKGEPLSTVGVDLGIWKYRKDLEPESQKSRKKGAKQLRSVTFYTWDFGGQEEYYATHQCFMSTRSLYLVVWDITEGEAGIEDLGPWLHNIQARAPGSPVVIVGTHCDRLKGDGEKEKRKVELNNIIYEKYLVGQGPQQLRDLGLPKILDVIYVSCPPTGRAEGVMELRMALYDIAFRLNVPKLGHNVSKTKLLEQPIPASFLKLEERVRQLAVECKNEDRPPLLKENLFREYTKDIIANPRELNQAVTFLHENGIMLHYATPALSHLYFVEPQWLCDMLAHVVTIPEVNRFIQRQEGPEAGILRTTVLSHVFKGKLFPHAHRREYIELLGKFEVALILDRNRLLVPSMLPPRPKYTIHAFRNVFPRPTLCQILSRSPDTAKLFSSVCPITNGEMDAPSGSPQQLGAVSHVSEELFRTGMILRRFYFMTYVPSGFWPRLISRFLTSSRFAVVVLQSLGYPESQIKDISIQLVSGQTSGAIGLEWSYWKTGIELWYKGLSLLRVAEILPQGTFRTCQSSPSIFKQSTTAPFEPALDTEDLSFELNGRWMPIDLTPNRGIELLIPDVICPSLLQQEYTSRINSGGPESKPSDEPQFEYLWMSAQLLSMSADYLDTLLEDWYPGLGAREGSRTVESIPYVNRVIPCPFCVSHACQLNPADYEAEPASCGSGTIDHELNSSSSSVKSSGSMTQEVSNASDKHPSVSPDKSLPYRSRSNDVFPAPFSPVAKEVKTKRALFSVASSPSMKIPPYPNGTKHHLSRVRSEDVVPRSNSLPKRLTSESPPERQFHRKSSLADLHRVKRDAVITGPEVLAQPLPTDEDAREMGLTQASKFGFMLESLILATRKGDHVTCPAHPDTPLAIKHLAPDVVFADLHSRFLLDPACVDKGEYVDHGTFGDIYHGNVYPSPTATDDEGREVAIKIDRLDSKKYTPDTATKAYIEVHAEVSILQTLKHAHVIDFVGVVLQPLCFILEWAPMGGLSSTLKKYRKVDARIGPITLHETAYQVASGLSYLHEHNIVYYDLKSPNVLVFQFPTPQESLYATQTLGYDQQPVGEGPVYVKIADLGISRRLSPGGVMGFKGSPGFMAPEILKYVGTEACTEKVDVFSFGMFLYELISLYFPFEKQNLMNSQIEKLIIEGERPPLQNKELNTPILYLDTMRWCWQQDFLSRPSSQQLVDVLSNRSVPRLVDAISLHNTTEVTCACISTLPIEILSPELMDEDQKSFASVASTSHVNVARGDLQEELWLCMHSPNDSNSFMSSKVCLINFRGKANFSTETIPVCNAKITSICAVSDTMWLGTEEGQVFIYDAITRNFIHDRHLAVLPDQSIISISHVRHNRQVLVTRRDGCLLLFDERLLEHKLSDNPRYDNHVNSTQLPVRSVFKTPEKLPILCAHVVNMPGEERERSVIWCGSKFEMLLVFDVYSSQIEYCRKLYNRPRYETSEENRVAHVAPMEVDGQVYMWALSTPRQMLYCWSTKTEKLIQTISCEQFTSEPVLSFCAMGSQLQLSLSNGKILLLTISNKTVISYVELKGHVKNIYTILPIGGRILPKHWLPSIIGRSNVIDYYRDLLGEDDIQDITSTMIGRQSRLLVSVGCGFSGLIADRLVEPLMSLKDREENFILLWSMLH